MPKKLKADTTLIAMILVTLAGYILIHDLLGGTLFGHSYWDSYTLQAMAWRNGHAALDQNYEWLELAIYKGNYFVSFPPFPSVVLYPLTFIFGGQTPNNLIIMLYAIISVVMAYEAMRHTGTEERRAAFWAVFVVLGSNMMWMSTNGGVWFQAQALNMALCLWAVLAAMKKKRVLSMALIALAVGCRPFSICLFPALLIYFVMQDKEQNPGAQFGKLALKQWKTLMIPILIGIGYMMYNYARFDNPLEFGHKYLPEFTNAPVFGMRYLWTNLTNIIRPITLTAAGGLNYPIFDGFLFFIANPFFIIFMAEIIRDIKNKRMTMTKATFIACILANLFLLLVHKTFGGWQFGARYTVDLLPLAFFYFLLNGQRETHGWEMAIGILAVMFNVYGALAMTFLHA